MIARFPCLVSDSKSGTSTHVTVAIADIRAIVEVELPCITAIPGRGGRGISTGIELVLTGGVRTCTLYGRAQEVGHWVVQQARADAAQAMRGCVDLGLPGASTHSCVEPA